MTVVSRFWKPLTVSMPGGVILLRVEPIDTPSVSVMRLESSVDRLTWLADGSSPVPKAVTVGSDSSSATQGSSTVSVAAKNRAPTKQCAKAFGANADATMMDRAARLAARIDDTEISLD